MPVTDLGFTRLHVDTAAGHISYLDAGAGPVALFVHGVGTSGLLWRSAIRDLAGSDRRCIALDLPLHGDSPARPGQDFSLSALADTLEALCAALELDGVDLVGNDTGGAVCQIFAVRHRERLATLALTNCETHDNVPPPAFRSAVRSARLGLLSLAVPLLLKRPALARRAVFGQGYEHPELLSDEIVLDYLQPVAATRAKARQFERFITSLRPDDLLAVEPGLRELDVPTLIVWGTNDVFFDISWARWLAATIPGVTNLVEIDGGHLFFCDERAAELTPHLRDHWTASRARSGAERSARPSEG